MLRLWLRGPHDYDVPDDGRAVGRIYKVNATTEVWWWGVDFFSRIARSMDGRISREAAMAEFWAKYERWSEEQPKI